MKTLKTIIKAFAFLNKSKQEENSFDFGFTQKDIEAQLKLMIMLLTIVFSSLINNVYASGENNLNEQIEETVKFRNGELSLLKDKTDFVKVSFKINEAGQLDILQMNYSNEVIKNQLVEHLKEIKISGSVDLNEVHNYNFSFIKK